MKKLQYLSCLILIVLIVIALMHKINLRFVDQNGASIRTDKITRLVKVPFLLHVQGYRLVGGGYKRTDHLLMARYKVVGKPLQQVEKAKYLGVTFQPTTVPVINNSQEDPFILSRQYDNGQKSGRDTLRILTGDQYGNFKVLSANYPAVSVRDPSIVKQGNTYYIIYTRGLLSTKDFKNWKQHVWPPVSGFKYSQDWAPEFVQGPNRKCFVTMSMQKEGEPHHKLMVTSFHNGKIGTKWWQISGNLPANTIDPDIQYSNGRYYLVCKNEDTRKLVLGSSSNLTGPYQMKEVHLKSFKYDAVEGPEMLINNGTIRLAFDTYDVQANGVAVFHGLYYTERSINGDKWSRVKKIKSPILTRHGQIILNK